MRGGDVLHGAQPVGCLCGFDLLVGVHGVQLQVVSVVLLMLRFFVWKASGLRTAPSKLWKASGLRTAPSFFGVLVVVICQQVSGNQGGKAFW